MSFEREVFPSLVGNGLYGLRAQGYWLDIGTPERYLQATRDILDRSLETADQRPSARDARRRDATPRRRCVEPLLTVARATAAGSGRRRGRSVGPEA